MKSFATKTLSVPHPRTRRVKILSFSGIDGAGKSTQIAALEARLRLAGLRVRLLSFWDDVAQLAGTREFSSYALFKGDKGVGAPGKPVHRKDKNVRTWYLTGARLVVYFLDALSLRAVVAKARRSDADIVIFDRYLYDEMANLSLHKPFTRAYARLLLRLAPTPDIAFVLDADPAAACERKPEYPVEFLQQNRASYLSLAHLAGKMTVIEPLPPDQVEERIARKASEKLLPDPDTKPEILLQNDLGSSGSHSPSRAASD